jgi:hypothetical protein
VCYVDDTRQDEDGSFDIFGFRNIFYVVNNESFSVLEPLTSDESEYVDALEENNQSQEDKGKTRMFMLFVNKDLLVCLSLLTY